MPVCQQSLSPPHASCSAQTQSKHTRGCANATVYRSRLVTWARGNQYLGNAAQDVTRLGKGRDPGLSRSLSHVSQSSYTGNLPHNVISISIRVGRIKRGGTHSFVTFWADSECALGRVSPLRRAVRHATTHQSSQRINPDSDSRTPKEG